MGDWRKIITIFVISVILLSTGLAGLSENVYADNKGKAHTTKAIHLGYLQLAAHDFFDMNRTAETDNENGKLDMSTVLFNPHAGQCNFEKSLIGIEGCSLYEDSAIANGGEKRSVENIMIATASAEVGEKYLQLSQSHGGEKAYQETLEFYHKQIQKAYVESFKLKFPKPQEGDVTNIHNLALRSGHDFLPAELMYDGTLTSIFAIDPLGEKLDKKEKKQASSPVDGVFDEEFTGIDFCPVPPFFCIKVDLLVADQTFGDQFMDDPVMFDDFMKELEDGRFDKKDQVSILLDQAFSFGLYLD